MEKDSTADPLPPFQGLGSAPSSSDIEEKKIWLDYIKTLNERRLQSAQRTGFTTYLLLAVLGGIAYRFIPRLPLFVRTPGSVNAAATFFLLQTDLIVFAALILCVLTAYCVGDIEFRLIPEHRRRLTQISLAAVSIVMMMLSFAHILVASRNSFTSPWVRRGLITLGLYWIVSSIAAVWKEVGKIIKSRKNDVPIPRFSVLEFEPNLAMSSLVITYVGAFAMVAASSLLLYVRAFSADWTQPWKASSVSLVFIMLSLYALNRWGLSIDVNNYLELERDIVLHKLSAEEIRTRFGRQLVGLDVSQWLDSLLTEWRTSNSELDKFNESCRKQLQEIQGIDPAYSAERRSRAQKLSDEMERQNKENRLQVSRFEFRIHLFFEGYLGPKDKQALVEWKQEYDLVMEESSRAYNDQTKLAEELLAIVKKFPEKQ
jgi:hypothetical protein